MAGWQDYVASVEDEFLATGKCPTEPPDRVAAMDGTMVDADVVLVKADEAHVEGGYWLTTDNTGAWWYSISPSGARACHDSTDSSWYQPGVGGIGLSSGVRSVEGVHPPLFRATSTLPASGDDAFARPRLTIKYDRELVTIQASTDPVAGSYMWMCIESVHGPTGFETAPAEWRGGLFVHVASWVLEDLTPVLLLPGDGPAPSNDFFFQFGPIACAKAEDAASDGPKAGDCYNWGDDCDGIDNDLDGVIDESSAGAIEMDQDGNGVVDCMDDWDGDGVPNFDDPDLDETDCWY